MHIFARLVRCLLGPSAVAAAKLQFGLPLLILGLDIHVDNRGLLCAPDDKKIEKWIKIIEEALTSGHFTPAQAGKLAGALCWAASHMFKRSGRAMLRPLFNHCRGKTSTFKVMSPLSLALRW